MNSFFVQVTTTDDGKPFITVKLDDGTHVSVNPDKIYVHDAEKVLFSYNIELEGKVDKLS